MLWVALGEELEDGEVSQTRPSFVFSTGTLPAGVCRRISAFESGCRNLTRSSVKGMRQYFRASQGRRLQEEKFLSPITSV